MKILLVCITLALCSNVFSMGRITNRYEKISFSGKILEGARIDSFDGSRCTVFHRSGIDYIYLRDLPADILDDVRKAYPEFFIKPERKIENTYVPTGAALSASVQVKGMFIYVTNQNRYMWGETRVMINRGFLSDGYYVDLPMVSSGETVKISGTDFATSKGNRFQPWNTVVQDIIIRTHTDNGKLESVVPMITQKK